jgi:glycosyltransferase involved in cell wall biosynthesis
MRVRFSHHIFRIESFGGVSRYITELHSGLLARGVDSRIVAPFHVNGFLRGRAGVTGTDISWVRPRVARQALARAVDQGWAHRAGRRLGPSDIAHLTYFDPVRPPAGRVVTTVYDMVHELYPAGVGRRDGTIETKRATCESADLVLTISEQTRTDLLERYTLDPQRVVVTPLGVRAVSLDDQLTPARKPFILYVGDRRRPYKNFDAFVAAYARLARGVGLVCFGGGPFTAHELAQFERLGITAVAHHAGGDDRELARYYLSARALVYPSLYEGFGLPPLEAMVYGCPVAAAAAGAIPEVVGPAALLFDPTDEDAIAYAIERVVTDDDVRETLVAAGRVRAAAFTWARTVDRTVGAYEAVLDNSS